jgi:hypothetical protein
MSDLYIPSTIHTPEISLSINERVLCISGKSRAGGDDKVYVKVLETIELHREIFSQGVFCDFHFENIINLNSLKMIMRLLNELKSLAINKNKVIVVWNYYSDEQEIKETGDVLSQILELPFKIRMVTRSRAIRKGFEIKFSKFKPYCF